MGEILARAFVYEQAKRAGVWEAEELRFYDPDNKISGVTDLMIRLPSGGVMGVEVKSLGTYTEVPCVRSGDRGYQWLEPRYKDLPQVMTYMQWFKQFGVNYWSLYYITRDGATNEFVFDWIDKPGLNRPSDSAYLRCFSTERVWELPWLTWGQVKARYTELLDHLNRQVVPPRDFMLTYSNEQLLKFADGAGGNQLNSLNTTESKLIKKRSESGWEGGLYLEKGDVECRYCSWRTLCWQGISPAGTPEIPVAKSVEEFEQKKRPKPPPADKRGDITL